MGGKRGKGKNGKKEGKSSFLSCGWIACKPEMVML